MVYLAFPLPPSAAQEHLCLLLPVGRGLPPVHGGLADPEAPDLLALLDVEDLVAGVVEAHQARAGPPVGAGVQVKHLVALGVDVDLVVLDQVDVALDLEALFDGGYGDAVPLGEPVGLGQPARLGAAVGHRRPFCSLCPLADDPLDARDRSVVVYGDGASSGYLVNPFLPWPQGDFLLALYNLFRLIFQFLRPEHAYKVKFTS